MIRNGKKIVLEDLPLYRGTYDGQPGRFGLLIGEMQIPTSFLTKLRFIGYQTLDSNIKHAAFTAACHFSGTLHLNSSNAAASTNKKKILYVPPF